MLCKNISSKNRSSVCHVEQTYWFSPLLPHLESRSTWHSRQAYKTHTHPQFSIGAIEQGGTRSHYRGQQHLLQAGDLILIDPHQPHSCNPLPGQTRSYHMLYLDTTWCLQQLSRLCGHPVTSLHSRGVVLHDPALFTRYQQLIAQLHQGEVAAAEKTLHHLITPILQQYCLPVEPASHSSFPPESTYHTTTGYVRQRLLSNLQTSPSLEALAEELNLRRETIVRQFRRETGVTPMAFLNNARVEYAKTLLRQGTPLADAGYQSGFCDQSHFHKTFVHYTAATPGQYRHSRSIFDNK
ncbi:AraC family transcriptional regulator [Brenneria roseae subsp. roseae]|uniref:AraC family transcriptional regulator n=1 Tax=Brenneria roseae TaxID=1509241 RepID=UPI000D606CF6|nr:AraC family transcriptional regulator [Brenneria roseae]PWC16271.1 AraC family transcriptional regulator [Brenneria roseae subsp. roseae]